MSVAPNGETWLPVKGWAYEVSSFGHIRRTRGQRLINPYWDKTGFGIVTLKRGAHEQEFYLDSIVASTFSGKAVNGARPLHVDGLPWNNWARDLMWGITMHPSDNLVINWTAWAKGRLQHGPYTDRAVVVAGCRPGDVVIGRNPKRKIVSFEIMFSRNRAMSPRNPFDLANEYRAAAKMHDDQFWSIMLSEAAEVVESLAANVLTRITGGDSSQLDLPKAQPSNGKFTVVKDDEGRLWSVPAPLRRRTITPPAPQPQPLLRRRIVS